MNSQHDPSKIKPGAIAYWKVYAGIGIILWAIALEVDMYFLTRTPEFKAQYGETDTIYEMFRKFWTGEFRQQMDEISRKQDLEKKRRLEHFESLLQMMDEKKD
eukprot:TRINITY_DN8650_c0_g1_i2.p3 TRINITY_DN8650_c0_g1~~TRINITY_DN8650_c0_g1_i2.p3  ORF type:complete len:103 (+),score=15.48 TRINITY_DN8650_c0_g1_i2:51-359(+)